MDQEQEKQRREQIRESGNPGGGAGRKDEVGRSGVWPMSGPLPPGNAELRGQAGWGQGERGAAGYEDHGRSALTMVGGQVLGGYEEAGEAWNQTQTGDIPVSQWRQFLDAFSRHRQGWNVVLEAVRDGVRGTEAENLPLLGVSSDETEGGKKIYIELGSRPDDHITHTIAAPRQLRFVAAGGEAQEALELGADDGTQWRLRLLGPPAAAARDKTAA